MKDFFHFGETVDGYDVKVLNEREARAGAGILLLPATASFVISYTIHDFIFTKIFITFFMLDFFIRIWINPKYAPTLIIGRLFVQNQTPEYVGAKQKKFAWMIGFILSINMFFVVVVFEFMTPIKIVVCLLCILLLFSESAFGICLGCIIYNKIQSKNLKYCPGNTCQIKNKEEIQKINYKQVLSLLFTLICMTIFSMYILENNKSHFAKDTSMLKCQSGKCGMKM